MIGNRPPGLHQLRRQIPTRPISPEPLTKTIKVTHCGRGPRGGLAPTKGMTHIVLTKEECNVPTINAKLQSVESFEGYMIADKSGICISDDPTTRDPSYWHFGQRQVGNALKYYAIKADASSKADTESDASDESDEDFQLTRSYATRGSKRRLSEKKIVARVTKKMHQKAAHSASDREKIAAAAVDNIQSPLRDTLRCTICLAVSRDPTVCKICENLIGCFLCVDTWATRNSTCPLHRCDWDTVDGSGFMKTRISFENVPGLYE
uniref:RING-type domain-containing protein n=1 Tax=Plectus sambesii TaxID=2011161 RepID=A0A914WQC8_9BILA